MKILTIIGSPHRLGNTLQAAKRLEEQMKSMGEYEFEYLFLKDARLESCLGCFTCISRGVESCPLADDREEIERKMAAADGVVLASPVYVMNVSSLMKNFIDRLAYLCHRPAYHGRKALVLTTTAGIGIKETLAYMALVTDSWGFDVAAKCFQITPLWPQKEAAMKKNTDNLFKAATRFAKALKPAPAGKSGRPAIRFKKYMSFRVFQAISRDVRRYMPADYKFYLDKEYYRPARISFLTRAATAVMLKVLFFMMRDMGPGNREGGKPA